MANLLTILDMSMIAETIQDLQELVHARQECSLTLQVKMAKFTQSLKHEEDIENR